MLAVVPDSFSAHVVRDILNRSFVVKKICQYQHKYTDMFGVNFAEVLSLVRQKPPF